MIEAMPTFYLFVLAALGAGLLPKGSMRAALLLPMMKIKKKYKGEVVLVFI